MIHDDDDDDTGGKRKEQESAEAISGLKIAWGDKGNKMKLCPWVIEVKFLLAGNLTFAK